jgi:CRP/FNR family transcriptional regulator
MAKSDRAPTAQAEASPSCFGCQWRERSQWCILDKDELDLLDQSKRCSLYPPGQTVIRQGDPGEGIFCVESGTVAVRKTDEHGNSALIRLCHAGDTIGYRDFFGKSPSGVSAEALAESRICFIGREAMHDLLARNPALGLTFLRRIAQDLDEAEQAILQASAFPIRTRLVHLLLTLRERYGTVNDDGALTISLPLARQDIAAILGSRPETVARTIHALEVDGVARFSGRNVIVDDLDRLLDEIDPDGEI